MGRLLAVVRACANADLRTFSPLAMDGTVVGRVHRRRVPRLRACLPWLREEAGVLRWNGDGPARRTERLAAALPALAAAGLSRAATGEVFDVVHRFGAAPRARCDRALLPTFGFRGHGVHVVGYVAGADGPRIWIPRRSRDRAVAPGLLDNTVAGGIAAGRTAADTLEQEAREEAGLDSALLAAARPAGTFAYRHQDGEFLRDDTLFLYDLPMPEDFRPSNRDGEVSDFALLSWQRVAGLLREGGHFKFNCGPVLIRFLLRHGLIRPDREPDYAALARALRLARP